MKKINYSDLNSRQKENYNFQKFSAKLADYGFNCIRLTDDWQGADFIAMHVSGNTFMKVQLKGRITFDKKYLKKDIWIAFIHNNTNKKEYYLYSHDALIYEMKNIVNYFESDSWNKFGGYSSGKLSRDVLEKIEKYKL